MRARPRDLCTEGECQGLTGESPLAVGMGRLLPQAPLRPRGASSAATVTQREGRTQRSQGPPEAWPPSPLPPGTRQGEPGFHLPLHHMGSLFPWGKQADRGQKHQGDT